MKKKLCSLLAMMTCLCTGISAAACNGADDSSKKDNSTPTNESITSTITSESGTPVKTPEEKWEEATAITNFNNVTFGMIAFDKDGVKTEEGVYMLAGDVSAYVDEGEDLEIMDKESTDALRTVFISTTLMVLDNFANFTYDAASGYYVAAQPITYRVDVFEYVNTEIIASNVKVKFDANFNITEITCDMVQNYVENGTPKQLFVNVTFTFWDYGTTVIQGSGNQGENPGGSGDVQISTGIGQEKWDIVFANAANVSNVTTNMTNNVVSLTGETRYMEQTVKISENITMTSDEDGYTEYFSMEDDQLYRYHFEQGVWVRNPYSGNAPIGSIFMQTYTSPFAGLYSQLTYNADTNTYEGENIAINQNGMDYTLYSISIEIDIMGNIVDLTYESDVFGRSNGEMIVMGRATISIKFSNYGTTVLEIPENFVEGSQMK